MPDPLYNSYAADLLTQKTHNLVNDSKYHTDYHPVTVPPGAGMTTGHWWEKGGDSCH